MTTRFDPDEAMATPKEEPLRHAWVWLVYVLLYAVSIPWYVPQESSPRLWLGVPHWIVVSILATLGVALFTVFVIARYWTDGDGESERDGDIV